MLHADCAHATHFQKCSQLSNSLILILYSFRTDELKLGTLKGTDKFGNKYYESDYYFFGE